MTSPAFGTSQRVLAYDLPRTGCRSLWTRTMPLAMFWVAPARPSACAALALRTLPPRSARLAGVAARKQERYVFDANDQKTQRVIKIWQTFPGLGISHIPAAPRPSDVAPGAAMEFDICGTRPSPGARARESPGALACHGAPDSAGLAPDQRPRRASGHRPRLALSCLRQ